MAIAGLFFAPADSAQAVTGNFQWNDEEKTSFTVSGGQLSSKKDLINSNIFYYTGNTKTLAGNKYKIYSNSAAYNDVNKCGLLMLVKDDKATVDEINCLGSSKGKFTYDIDQPTTIKKASDSSSAVRSAERDKAFAVLAPVLAVYRDRFKSGCENNSGTNVASENCFENAWKATITECYGQSIGVTQSDKAKRQKFSDCMVKKLNGVASSRVNDVLENSGVSLSAVAVEAARAAEGTTESTGGDVEELSCAINGVGWFFCSLIGFLADATDLAFGFLATAFLEIRSGIVGNDAIRNAWGAMRNIANIVFVIAFMVVVYGQMTGRVLSNYNIKKLLPKIILSAILVNVSFFICQLAVDISNLLGYSLNSMISSLGGESAVGGAPGESNAPVEVGATFLGLAAAGVTLALIISIPVIIFALLALVTVLMILFARIALIIILTVVSPLAFVAILLPNTEQWFKRWYSIFLAMLMVFPIISVVAGVSALAARVILGVASELGSDQEVMMSLVALGVATIPLFAIPILLKNSMNSVGKIGAMLSGQASRFSGKASGAVRENAAYRSRINEVKTNLSRRKALRRARFRSNNAFTRAIDNSAIGKSLGLDYGARAAEKTVLSNIGENIELAASKFSGVDFNSMIKRDDKGDITDMSEVEEMFNGASKTERAAMVARLIRTTSPQVYDSFVSRIGADSSQDHESVAARQSVASVLKADGPKFLKGSDIDAFSRGAWSLPTPGEHDHSTPLERIARSNVESGVYSHEAIASENGDTLKYAFNSTTAGGKMVMQRTAQEAFSNPESSGKIKHNRGILEDAATIKIVSGKETI